MSTNENSRLISRVAEDARALAALYEAPQILRVVNVWDAVSAKVVADLPGTTAIATAGHGIAASHGYPDGERIPFELMLISLERIVAVTDLPVTADLDGGFGDAGEAVRRAIGVGVCGANIEDQMRPLDESALVMRAAMGAALKEGLNFVLNARTDAGGSVTVELLDAAGQPLPDYSGANAARFAGDATRATLTWKDGGLKALPRAVFRLRLTLQKADCFALYF